MSSFYSLIKRINEVGLSKRDLVLKLRIIRSYALPIFGNPTQVKSHELVCHDRSGERIHATIRLSDFNRFNVTFSEGQVIVVQYIVIEENNMSLKTTSSLFKLTSSSRTKLHVIDEPNFPLFRFDFQPISKVLQPLNLNESLLIDVIGMVTIVGDKRIIDFKGRESICLDITIKNTSGHVLLCTLWADTVDELMNVWLDKSNHPIIIIIQFGRSKVFQGEVRLSSTFHVTKVIINDEGLDAITDFKKRLSKQEVFSAGASLGNSTSSNSNVHEDISTGNVRLMDLKSLAEDYNVGKVWVCGRIEDVEHNSVWWYLSCMRCSKKITKVGDKMFCDKCNRSDTSGSLRYKIIISLTDDNGVSVKVLLWNREAVQLIGISASDLNSKMEMEKKEGTPKEILSLVNKELMFKLQEKIGINNNTRQFNVMAINLDGEVISKYSGLKQPTMEDNEQDLLSILATCDFLDEDEGSFLNSSPCSPKYINLDENSEVGSSKRNLVDEFSTSSKKLKAKLPVKQEK